MTKKYYIVWADSLSFDYLVFVLHEDHYHLLGGIFFYTFVFHVIPEIFIIKDSKIKRTRKNCETWEKYISDYKNYIEKNGIKRSNGNYEIPLREANLERFGITIYTT